MINCFSTQEEIKLYEDFAAACAENIINEDVDSKIKNICREFFKLDQTFKPN